MGDWKFREIARLALLGKNVLVFCSNKTELNKSMLETNEAIWRLINGVHEGVCPSHVRFCKNLGIIYVGDAWIKFEVSSRSAGRGLMVDYAFVDEIAEYQNWFKEYCTTSGMEKAKSNGR